MIESVNKKFYDEKSGLYYFSDIESSNLVANKIEISDNVISSPNSIMANNLFLLSKYLDEPKYQQMSENMVATVFDKVAGYPSFHSNWGILLLNYAYPFYYSRFYYSASYISLQGVQNFANGLALNLPMAIDSSHISQIP